MNPDDKVKKMCIALNPRQISQIRVMQGKYILKHDKSLSFSKVISIVIKNGLKITRQRDLEK